MKSLKPQHITLLVAILAGLMVFIWGDLFLGKHPFCLYQSLFGIPCPFCGLTRAAYEFMHLRFISAWKFNPLVYLLAFWFLSEIFHLTIQNNSLDSTLRIIRILLLVCVILFLILRWFKYFPLP
jgi:hypothetical protein